MLSSGPKSYYDEYVRKKDTERVFAKPPALLTDRNAYINFLEVQLERVSAACFAVHGHESRFNDMQGLVVSLDEKLNTSTRLISVAQQGTEEVRAEFYQRSEIESNAAKSYRQESRNAIEALTSRVLQMEKIVTLLPQIEGKLNAFDKRMGEYETKQRSVEQENRVANKVLQERIETLNSEKNELFQLIESTRASVSRVTFDVEENTTRVNNYIAGVENRVNLAVQDSKEDFLRELSAVQAKSTNQYEEVRRMMEVRELEMLTTTRKHHQALQEEVEESRRRWTQDLESLSEKLQSEAARRVESVQHSVTTGLQDLRASQNHQAAMMCDIEEGLLNQLNTVQSHIEEVSVHQKSAEERLNTTNKTLEEKLQELQTTLNNTTLNNTLHNSVHNSTLPHPSWGGHHFFPPPPPGSHQGASFLSESFGPGGGAPLSPVTRAADGSFYYNGQPLNASFAQSQTNYNTNSNNNPNTNPHNNTSVMPFPANVSHPGTVPTSPISVHTAQGTHSTHHTQQSHHSQHTHQSHHTNLSTRLNNTSPGNSRAASVSRRFAQAKARSRSTSPGGVTASGTGASRGTRKKKVDSSVEVIQKFLEIYDADQQDISRRLEEMGAPPPAAAKPSTRRKQQQQHSVDGETPGEVLGNFFLNYKKDRQDIMKRLSSLTGPSNAAGEDDVPSGEESETEFGQTVGSSPRGATQSSHSQHTSQHQSSPLRAQAHSRQLQDPQQSSVHGGSVRSTSAGAGSSTVHSVPGVQREDHSHVSGTSGTTGTSSSTDPAGKVVENIVSRSMDEFMRTYRNRGGGNVSKRNARARTPRTTSPSTSLLHDHDDSHELSHTDLLNHSTTRSSSSINSRSGRASSKSPNRLRLRTGALLTSLRDGGGRDRFKRYMQMTESQTLAQSMSPSGTVGAVDVSAVRWEYDNVSLKPIWKVPNTYQSPGRVRANSQGNSQSSSRAGSISPGARTASSLIDRLLRQDRYASMHGSGGNVAEAGPVSVSASFAAPVAESVPGHVNHSTQTRGASVTVVSGGDCCCDNVSVASSVTTKTTTTTSSHK